MEKLKKKEKGMIIEFNARGRSGDKGKVAEKMNKYKCNI